MSNPADNAITDTDRLNWLSKNMTVNLGLAVGGYKTKSGLVWQGEDIRAAIDAEIRKKADVSAR